MRTLLPVAPLLIMLLTGCGGGDLTSPEGDALLHPTPVPGLSVTTGKATFGAGEAVPAVFHNRSQDTTWVSALSCTAGLERHEGERWRPLVSFRYCIQSIVAVAPGADYDFVVSPPDTAGEYRIVVSLGLQDTVLQLTSGVFTVE